MADATKPNNNECCCGSAPREKFTERPLPLTGTISTAAGEISVVDSRWRFSDRLGAVAMRLNILRMDYAVKPGLYAVGKPGPESPVLVSANYKLSFDVLRRELAGLNAWLLVLDTKGINVWCAAGKGTFGTMEIGRRVMMTGLSNVVSHHKLIVPQLGAPGVAAHMVKAFCDFEVVYGPVRARDIKPFLAAGMKATSGMRRVRFTATDRLAVGLTELALAFKQAVIISAVVLLAGSIFTGGWKQAGFVVSTFWAALVSGSLLSALLLPLLPGRMFSVKGGVLGALVTVLLLFAGGKGLSVPQAVSLVLLASALSAYLTMNLTGSSTFTSLSGVRKELKYSIPVLAGMVVVAGLVQIVSLLGR